MAAAAPGGKRFDTVMTPKGRRAIENGVWLCQTCATLVDRDGATSTVPRLLQTAYSSTRRSGASSGRSFDEGLSIGRFVIVEQHRMSRDEWLRRK